MIVTKPKNLSDILKYLEGHKTISIIGCGACAAACQSGGKEDVERMAKSLSSKFKINLKTVVDEACHHLLTKKQLREYTNQISESDCILAMTCGAGVQCLSEIFPDKEVFPANDTHILGNAIRTGQFKSYCSMCGDCILGETAGICVKTRCPKSHLNGPCGGMFNGKCEVNKESDCVYVLIYKKNKKINNKKLLKNDFSKKINELKLPRKKL